MVDATFQPQQRYQARRAAVPGPPPTRARRGEMFEYLIACGLVALMVAVQLPLLTLRTITFDLAAAGVDLLRFVPFVIAFMLAVNLAYLTTFRRFLTKYAQENASGLWWVLVASAAVFTVSLIHGNIMSVLYSLILLFVTANMTVLWVMNLHVARLAFRAMFVVSAFTALSAFFLFGVTNRWVGGIHPNFYGAVLLGMGFFWVLGFDRWNAVVLAVPLLLAAVVSSRYSFLALVIFTVVVVGLDRRIAWPWKAILAFAGIFLLLLPPITRLLADVFLLGDVDRGLQGGLSGRFELYSSFLPQMERSPWIGYGFRALDQYESSHNGYLTTLLENGIIVGAVLFAWVIARTYRAIVAAVTTGQRVAGHVAGGLLGVSAGAFFQPQLFNFGDAMGLSFLMFLMAPIATRRAPKLTQAPVTRPLARHAGAAV